MSVEQQGEEYSPDLEDTLRSLRAYIIGCKGDTNRLIEAHEIFPRAQEN